MSGLTPERIAHLRALFGPAPEESSSGDPLEGAVADAAPEPPDATALRMGGWTLQRGRLVRAAESDILALPLLNADPAAADLIVADLFEACFAHEPAFNPRPPEPVGAFLREALGSPDFISLRGLTALDAAASSMAAVALAEQYEYVLSSSSGASSGAASGVEGPVARAVVEARRRVEEFSLARSAAGLGPGSPGASDPERVAALRRRLLASKRLKEIFAAFGRFQSVAAARQRSKPVHGWDDVTDVVPGASLTRLLPSELARLAHPLLRLDALRRYSSGSLLGLEVRDREAEQKGPVCVVVDSSGSMHGQKGYNAVALALAFAWLARRQRRWCGLINYSGNTGERLLALPPGSWPELEVLEWADTFFGGGSCRDVPVVELPSYWKRLGPPAKQTDIVMVTDAICHLSPGVIESFNAWRREVGARVTVLLIDSESGALSLVADKVLRVRSLSAEEEGVGEALSL